MHHAEFVGHWQDRVRLSGWHAWRFIESPEDAVIDIQWFTIEQQGTIPMVVYFIAGHGQKQNASEPLKGIVVCPVQVAIDFFAVPPKPFK